MIDAARLRRYLRDFDLQSLFVEELGWDHHTQRLDVQVDGHSFFLAAIAHKRGMVAFLCSPAAGGRLPDYGVRRKIERMVARSVHEHIVVFADREKTTQVWQWVKDEKPKPKACREHTYHVDQSGEALIQKLRAIAFGFEEEETLTIVHAAGRVRAAFDVERVTKRFYDRFKAEHATFLQFLRGIPDEEMQRWYVSVMLNRLMFIYFVQKKGFLDGNPNYLRAKLGESTGKGRDLYYSEFLCPLFFEGFAKKEGERSTAINRLLGKAPYLNGGLFLRHQIEEAHGAAIVIPDAAFEKLFDFFDGYQWHLDERPLRADNEINPDVLGYIFEKYINQKQMGAYYTKEDITEYIGKNTIVPYLFDAARQKCRIAFEGDGSVWRLLQADPDRYIYPAVKQGVDSPLPPEIAAGLADVSRRGEWNKPAPPPYALPTEIWREVVARRKRYQEVRAKLADGEIQAINDLITYNLDIRQFARDVIENCEGPELLRAFYKSIEEVTVLDPTCGSGAFLFAALNILEDLYEACLDRMEAFLEELDRSGEKHHPAKYAGFRRILQRVEQHPNRRYFILKSIIVKNLYGADIMEEAVEICKLRLFLKLVSQVEKAEKIEPLPDIDFNIRAGNTLVGYATYDDVRRAMTLDSKGNFKMQLDDTMQRIEEKAQDLERLSSHFRQQQTALGGEVTAADKQELRKRLRALEDELNRHLAQQYTVDASNSAALLKWLSSYLPFHWFVEFHGIMSTGGFKVIIGNPPYLEQREVDYSPRDLRCSETGTIHAMCVERGLQLLHRCGCSSMVVPLALVSTQRMAVVQRQLETNRSVWYANFSWRPGKLFDTVNRALTIFIIAPESNARTYSTNYQKWTSDNRELLMSEITYIDVPRKSSAFWVPKLGNEIERSILNKCLCITATLGRFMANSGQRVYYRTTGGLYWKVFTNFPPAFTLDGKPGHSTRETWLGLRNKEWVVPTIAVLSGDVFWWWYTITTNCRDLNPTDIQDFPVPETALHDPQLLLLGGEYLNDLSQNSSMLVRMQKQTGRTETLSFKIQKSKRIIEQIDRVLARHYGFTDEELDFIINYDIKYRMGRESSEGEE